jgi:ABC-2 type transport system permease protein
MSGLWAITVKDLRQRWRDHSALLSGVVAPLVMALLISLAFGRGETRFSAKYGVVDGDGGVLARSFVDDVLGSPSMKDVATITRFDDVDSAVAAARNGDVAAVFVIPAGFSGITQGGSSRIEIVRSGQSPIGADVAEAIANDFAHTVDATRLAVATALDLGASDAQVADLATRSAQQVRPLELQALTAAGRKTSPASYFAPAMGVFFAYFVAALGARGFVAERKQGTFSRLLAAPISGRVMVVGKVLATFVLGVVALGTMAVASRILFNARWGPPLPAAAIILAIVFATTCITACVLSLARTEQQVALFMSLATYAMALLGGNFVNLSRAPVVLRRISLATPNGWALRAFGDLATTNGGFGVIVRPLLAIIAFGVATGTVAVLRSDHLVEL